MSKELTNKNKRHQLVDYLEIKGKRRTREFQRQKVSTHQASKTRRVLLAAISAIDIALHPTGSCTIDSS